jgi:hypothetical protein
MHKFQPAEGADAAPTPCAPNESKHHAHMQFGELAAAVAWINHRLGITQLLHASAANNRIQR